MFTQRTFLNATQTLPIILNPTFLCASSRELHTSIVLDRWYKRFFQTKRVFTPPKNPFNYDLDWENEPYKPLNSDAHLTRALNIPKFADIEHSAKRLFTYQFVSQKDQLNEQIRNELIKLGFEPTDQSVAARIVRMTIEVRYRKWLYSQHPLNKTLRANLGVMIATRQRLLRLLRLTNQAEFDRLTSSLRITGYMHPDPFLIPTNDPTVARKKDVRKECYQLRLAKLASLKNQLRSTEQEFYKRKQAQLNEILGKLAKLDLPTKSDDSGEQASVLLRNLFDEVVKERQSNELLVPQMDRLNWYALEAKQREEYLAKQAQKAEKQLRRMKK